MASDEQIREAVDHAKALLEKQGRVCRTSVADLKAWFNADTPFEDSCLDDIIGNPYLVIHELVEVDEVLEMGLKIGKNTIVDNIQKVDEAHLKATTVELLTAFINGDGAHISSRLPDIQRWIDDPTVTTRQKKKYRRLHASAVQMASVASIVGGMPKPAHK